jgi:transmembrane sensor
MEKAEFNSGDFNLLIISYLTGSITDKDLTLLRQMLDSSIENRRYFNELKDSWMLAGAKRPASLNYEKESWNIFKEKLPDSSSGTQKSGNSRLTRYLKLAASWILIFGFGSAVTWWISSRTKEKPPLTSNRTIEVYTPLGARSIIRMPDSTQIWLNAGTTITYREDYGQTTRSLQLKGEAYFKVAKDSLHPFIVNTQDVIIRALGTRFNVKAYPEEKTISATLEEGRIDIKTLNMSENDERVLLNPKEKLIYHKETKKSEKYADIPEEKIDPVRKPVKTQNINILSNVRTELYTSWKDARWIIYREPLASLAPMLERRFNMKIIFGDDQLKDLKFTGIIENETVDQLLGALKLTAPIEYHINKDTVQLKLDEKATEDFKKIMIKNN